MLARLLLLWLCWLGLSASAFGQIRVVSSGPDTVSVSIYRDPERSEGGDLDLNALGGFAVVSETRRIRIPAGRVTLAFEGVAEGIVPVSAIVTGLPGGVIQKNRDARLLSPAALVDGSLGRRIHLKRTSRATGKVIEENAEVIAGPQGGVVIRTSRGFEALGCSGLPESLGYDGVPPGLNARPTLSVETDSPSETDVVVQLSYLATGFDWTANYVVRIDPSGKTLHFFAWLTLANGNAQSFPNAQTQVIAGSVNKEDNPEDVTDSARSGSLSLQCWPQDITSTHPRTAPWQRSYPLPPPAMADYGGEDIVVTAQKRSEMLQSAPVAVTAMSAEQEELGDLKLYRIPELVTVAAHAQKQVAMIEKRAVPFERVYQADVYADNQVLQPEPLQLVLRLKNEKAKGLGIPLPSGGAAVFEPQYDQMLLLGQTQVRDTPVSGEVELKLSASPQIHYFQQVDKGRATLIVTNANPYPVLVEISLVNLDGRTLPGASSKLTRKNGAPFWRVRIGANKVAKLTYGVQVDQH
jgi:hypothetical protein